MTEDNATLQCVTCGFLRKPGDPGSHSCIDVLLNRNSQLENANGQLQVRCAELRVLYAKLKELHDSWRRVDELLEREKSQQQERIGELEKQLNSPYWLAVRLAERVEGMEPSRPCLRDDLHDLISDLRKLRAITENNPPHSQRESRDE